MEPEIWQIILEEAGIQMDIETIQSLSEDCLIRRIMEYLNKSNSCSSEEILANPTNTPQVECISYPDPQCEGTDTKNINTTLPSACNEISVKDLCITDELSPDRKHVHRPIKILFRLLANVRNLMATNQLISLEMNGEQKNIDEENDKLNSNKNEVAATTINGIKDSINLIQELQQKTPANLLNESTAADVKTYATRHNQSMVALENLRIEIDSESNENNSDEKLMTEECKLQNSMKQSELKIDAVIINENFNLLNKCTELLLNEISEGVTLRKAMGKQIFED